MVRRGDGGRINYAKYGGYEDDEEDDYSEDEGGDGDYDYGSKKKAKKSRSPAKRTPTKASRGRGRGRGRPAKGGVARKGPRGKISPSKTPASKRKYASQR